MHWLNTKLQMRPHAVMGFGVFTSSPIITGELVCVWGGEVVDEATLAGLSEETRTHALQIEDTLYLTPPAPLEPADYINHSCDPNVGVRGQVTLVALRDIAAGEQICFDYAMTDSSPYDEFRCGCGTSLCRGVVRGSDWQRPELQARYRGFFSAYLERRQRA